MAATNRVTCECADHACPVHLGRDCAQTATETLRRADFSGEPLVLACSDCAEDMMDSGVFGMGRG